MKLSVSEEMYELLKWYRRVGYLGWPDSHRYRPIRSWYTSLSPDGECLFRRFLNGDDSAIVVKTEPSPTIKDSLESLADKVDDIGDIIKGVVENLEKELIPDNDLKYIVRFNEKGISSIGSIGILYDVPTERYVSKVTFGHIELSRDPNKAVQYSTREEANGLAKELNGSLDKLGLPSHGRFMSYRRGE